MHSRDQLLNDSVSNTSPGGQSGYNLEGFTPRLEEGNTDDVQFLIPEEHCTSTTWLLSLPTLQRLLGDYPDRYFHSLEKTNSVPMERYSDTNAPPAVHEDDEAHSLLLDQYFAGPHCHYPIFTRMELEGIHVVATSGIDDALPRAIDSLVCALGMYQNLMISYIRRLISFVELILATHVGTIS